MKKRMSILITTILAVLLVATPLASAQNYSLDNIIVLRDTAIDINNLFGETSSEAEQLINNLISEHSLSLNDLWWRPPGSGFINIGDGTSASSEEILANVDTYIGQGMTQTPFAATDVYATLLVESGSFGFKRLTVLETNLVNAQEFSIAGIYAEIGEGVALPTLLIPDNTTDLAIYNNKRSVLASTTVAFNESLYNKRDVYLLPANDEVAIVDLNNPGEGQDPAGNLKEELSVEAIAEEFAPAVVYLEVDSGSGSGFIISPEGHVVTNYHVIQESQTARIHLENGDVYEEPLVLGYSEELDIALLKIEPIENKPLPHVLLGDPANIKQGNKIVTIGSPKGLFNSLSTGEISQVHFDKIQISAPISPGSSGGALFNMYGEVIGITSQGVDGAQNLGFAIPINKLEEVPLDLEVTMSELYGLELGVVPPEWVSAVAISPHEIELSWSPVTGVDDYHVYIDLNGDGQFLPRTVDGVPKKYPWISGASVLFKDIGENTTAAFKVAAVKDGIVSALSEATQATTFTAVPLPPTDIKAKAVSETDIQLDWDSVSGSDHYYVYRSNSPTQGFKPILNADGENKHFYAVDRANAFIGRLEPNTTVWFRVVSVRGEELSDFSEAISATTWEYPAGAQSKVLLTQAAGLYIKLYDNSLWQVAQTATSTSGNWLAGEVILIDYKGRNDQGDSLYTLTNATRKESVEAVFIQK